MQGGASMASNETKSPEKTERPGRVEEESVPDTTDVAEEEEDGVAGATSSSDSPAPQPRSRRARQFPASTFEEALVIGLGIQQYGGGQRIRRLLLFDHLGRKASSRLSRQLVTSSVQYGITRGHQNADFLELTTKGAIATSDEADPRTRLETRFELTITSIDPFDKLYERFKGARLPAPAVLRDAAIEIGIPHDDVQECVDTFVVNAKYLGLLKTLAGAERLIGLEQALEDLRQSEPSTVEQDSRLEMTETTATRSVPERQFRVVVTEPALDQVCFYIAPIGDEATEWRKHSDLFMGQLVEPALREFQLTLIRADAISKPGIINAQVIEHIVRCRLVIADLSFHNPNVFYELALRHATRKPIVQLIRTADRVPFDLQTFRTIQIDNTDIYTFVPQIDTYRSQIASQIRTTLSDTDQAENPLSLFYPSFWADLPTEP